MVEYTLEHPPIRKPARVLLTRKWSDWDAGDIITMDSEKADRVIAKGYGEHYKPPKSRGPKVETATAEPQGEKAVVTPQKEPKTGPQEESGKDSKKGK